MSEFLVELYISNADPGAFARDGERARRAAAALTAEGTPVRLLRSICVPADETCLLLYEAGSLDAVLEAARRAGLSFEHVAETTPECSI